MLAFKIKSAPSLKNSQLNDVFFSSKSLIATNLTVEQIFETVFLIFLKINYRELITFFCFMYNCNALYVYVYIHVCVCVCLRT